jgi:hypothetical protein
MFYPGAYHAFDFPILAGGRRSELEARDFLATELTK